MRGFQYALQKVLDLKTNEKKQAEWILSEAVGDLMTKESQLQQCTADLLHAREELQRHVDARASASSLQVWQQYIAYMESQVDLANERVSAAEANVQNKQGELAVRMTDEKVWTKAREKAEAQFNQQLAAWEQNELDELATVRYHMAAR
ncbi:flagellar export protein FliJ [Paenibacillus thiaminolyticus]|uniref:Flagellar FliJ protein n=1 Tax=Paenibacillus thiaminolyticus TaxID=49283 RepID=A0A3A3GGF6_PANTH|nr:flagellar export protein FliJ [Paenibacillus thiaminolyticus]RJG22292.1 flagellar export protein FliJ [Paenibacillus thiaminolyticus]